MYLSSKTENKALKVAECPFVYKAGEFYMIYALLSLIKFVVIYAL